MKFHRFVDAPDAVARIIATSPPQNFRIKPSGLILKRFPYAKF